MKIFTHSPYFLSQRLGRWRWPWLLLAFFSFIPVSIIFGLVFKYLLHHLSTFTERPLYQLLKESDHLTDPLLVLLELLSLGLSLWAVTIVGTLIQGRSVRSLIAPIKPFRWGLAGKALCLAIFVQLLFFVIPIPGLRGFQPIVHFNGFRLEHVYWLLPLTFCILLQTSGEDVFFKGFLLRQFGALIPVFWVVPVLITLLFSFLHIGNPDFMKNIGTVLVYFTITELLVVYCLMRSGGMEIPLVLHFLNNVFLFVICSEEGTQANDLTL